MLNTILSPKFLLLPLYVLIALMPSWPLTVCFVALVTVVAIESAIELREAARKDTVDTQIRELKSRTQSLEEMVKMIHLR